MGHDHMRLQKIAEAPLHPRFRHDRRKHIIKLWRKGGFGRLYWRDQHPNWRWDSDEIARAKSGARGYSFTSTDAIEIFLEMRGIY